MRLIQNRNRFADRGAATPFDLIGRDVSDAATAMDALRDAGLDWNVGMQALRVDGFPGSEVPARAVVREDTGKVLGVVGSRFVPIQNSALAAAADVILANGATLDTAGDFEGGKRVWMSFGLGNDALADFERKSGGDRLEARLFFGNGHDGATPLAGGLIIHRVICGNTFAMAMVRKGSLNFRLKHTTNVAERFEMAVTALRLAREAAIRFGTAAAAFVDRTMTREQQVNYLAEVLGLDAKSEVAATQRRMEVAVSCLDWERSHAVGANTGTLWSAFNAITNYTSHADEVVRGEGKSESGRLALQIDGSLAEINARAFRAAEALVSA